MNLLPKILFLSCCSVGILHANIFDKFVNGLGYAVSSIANAIDLGNANIFNYTTDYNATEMVKMLSKEIGLTSNYVFNNNSGVKASEKVKMYCINSRFKKLQQTKLNDPDISSKILKNKQLVLVTHGWLDDAFKTWVQNILNAWIHKNTGTICAVDWDYLANYEYTIAATKYVYKVAKIISKWLTVTTGLIGITNKKVILVGHSLGAHISGMVGMHQKGTISKIFALDPASPLFCAPILLPIDRRLDKTDAKFVQVIMTAWGAAGCVDVCGNQTFYPNGGIAPQPSCYAPILQKGITPETVSCSHTYVCELFWWSLFKENDFTSNQCSDYLAYLAGSCNGSDSDQMGWYHKKTTGIYYLTTDSKPPSGSPSAPSTPN